MPHPPKARRRGESAEATLRNGGREKSAVASNCVATNASEVRASPQSPPEIRRFVRVADRRSMRRDHEHLFERGDAFPGLVECDHAEGFHPVLHGLTVDVLGAGALDDEVLGFFAPLLVPPDPPPRGGGG